MSASFYFCSSTSRGLIIKSSCHDQYTGPRGCFILIPSSNLAISHNKHHICFSGPQSWIHLSHGGVKRNKESRRKFAVHNSVQPSGLPPPAGPPPPSGTPPSGPLKGWIIGIALTVVLPFLVHKFGKNLLRFENKVEAIVEKVENAVEGVEKVAEKVEKVAENVASHLPEGDLKNAATLVEMVADRIDDTAELAGKAIDKVQEFEEKAESAVESSLEKKETVPNEAKEPAKGVKVKA